MATATLSRRPKRYEAKHDDDFVVFEAVPVWKEHTISEVDETTKKVTRTKIDKPRPGKGNRQL